jgi:hypothetical protein
MQIDSIHRKTANLAQEESPKRVTLAPPEFS